jgi:hypothetical protein
MNEKKGPSAQLRSWAVTLVLVSVAIYLGAHLISAAVPVLCVAGVVAVAGYIVWFFIVRRRW